MSAKDSRMWIELSNGKESDWRACFTICRRAFQNDPLYIYTHPEPNTRAKFIEKYFDWLYHVVFKDGRGLLVVIKELQPNGEEKVIGGMSVTLDWDEEAEEDDSSWRSVDEEGWKRHLQRDEWEVENIYEPLAKVAKDLGTTIMPGVFQMVDDGYRGQGIGSKFIMKGVQMMSDEVVKRKRRAGDRDPKPPLAYCICDNQRSRKFTKNCGFIEVAQIRTNVSLSTNSDIGYSWVFLLPTKDPLWIELTRKAFHYPSNL